MAAGVAGHVNDLPGAAQGLHGIATLHALHGLGQLLVGGAPDLGARGLAQLRHAADMIGMVVGD